MGYLDIILYFYFIPLVINLWVMPCFHKGFYNSTYYKTGDIQNGMLVFSLTPLLNISLALVSFVMLWHNRRAKKVHEEYIEAKKEFLNNLTNQ